MRGGAWGTPEGGGVDLPPKYISSTNPSTPGVTTTPPHPQYQNNSITNTRRKFTETLNKEYR